MTADERRLNGDRDGKEGSEDWSVR